MGLRSLLGLDATQRSAKPANPPSGRRLLYPKSDGWYDQDSAGADVRLVNTTDSRLLDARVPTDTATAALRVPSNLSGGGTITITSGNTVSWNKRFITISNGTGSHFSTQGFFNIDMPPDGTVIPGLGGATDQTVTGGTLYVGAWWALYYILPIGSGSGTVAGNFRLVAYTSAQVVPETWVLVCIRTETGWRWGNGALMQGPNIASTWTMANPFPQYVQTDDSRLSDARTPTAHTHPTSDVVSGVFDIARIPVAASGTSSTTQVVRADDSRLSNSRAPSGTAGGHLAGTYPSPSIATNVVADVHVAAANKDGAVGTPSMRTLGTGAQQAAAGNHAHSSHTGVSNIKVFYNLLAHRHAAGTTTGSLVITTPITFDNYMTRVEIKGYNYATTQDIDASVGFYAHTPTNPSFAHTYFQNDGRHPVTCRLARNASNQVVIILDSAANWTWTLIEVPRVIGGHTMPPDSWNTGWSATITTDLTPYTLWPNAPTLRDTYGEITNLRGRTISAGTGLTGGGDLTANRTLTVDFGTGTNQSARGDHTHASPSQSAFETAVFGAAGRTVAPTARIYKTNSQTFSANTTTQVLFNTAAYGTDTGMADTTNNRIVVPIAGLYLVILHVTTALTFDGTFRARVLRNGAGEAEHRVPGVGAGAGWGSATCEVVVVMSCGAGDLITADAWHNATTSQTIDNSRAGTFMQARWMSAAL